MNQIYSIYSRCVAQVTKQHYFYLAIILTLTPLHTKAQDDEQPQPQYTNTTDAAGKRQGLWLVKGKNNTLEAGNYINGKKDGVWVTTLASGAKKHELTFKNGLPQGKAIFYYEDGGIMESGEWNINHWKGEYTFYHKNGQIAYKFNFNDAGKRIGKQLYFHENGNLKYSGTWIDGKPDGAIEIFNEEGAKVSERIYADGEFSQNVKTASAEKDQKSYGVFDDTGQFTLFNNKGKISRKGYFEKGKLINGTEYIYSEDNQLIKTIKYSNGIILKEE